MERLKASQAYELLIDDVIYEKEDLKKVNNLTYEKNYNPN